MRVNAFVPTQAEIGDPVAKLAQVIAFRQQMKPKPIARPVVVVLPIVIKKPELEALPRGPHRLDKTRYIYPIVGPCQPDHIAFKAYSLDVKSEEPEPEDPRRIKIEDCIKYVCLTEDTSKMELLSQRRQQSVVILRHRAIWLCKRFTVRSFPEIGRRFGGRDHTTVMHAVRRMNEAIAKGIWTPPTADEILALVRPAALCAEAGG